LGDLRAPLLWPALISLSAVVAIWLLYLTSYKTFFYDEWDFIVEDRPWNLNVFLLPHNEHWVTIPLLVWKVLFLVVGIRTYVPYEAALLVVHVAAVLLLFQFIRRHSGDLPAFGAAFILLVLGGGGKDIVWAFQIEFVGSIAFGLAALLLIDGQAPTTKRVAGASAALLGSLMCSGVGLAFLAAMAAMIALDRNHRKFWPVLVIPTVAFGAWFVTYGAGLPGTPGNPCASCPPMGFRNDIHRGPIGLDYISSLAAFVVWGLEASIGAVFAVANEGAAVSLAAVAALLAVQVFRQKSAAGWRIAMLAGLFAWFTLVGLGRASRGLEGATDSHYLYIGAVFLLPLIAGLAREFPSNLRWWPVVAIVFALVVYANTLQLRDVALQEASLMTSQAAKLQTVEAFRGAPDMDVDRNLDDKYIPQLKPRTYLAAVDELGSPVPSATPSTLSRLPHQPVDEEMINLFGKALTVGPSPTAPSQDMPCRSMDASSGVTVDFDIPANRSVILQGTKTGDAFLLLGFLDPPPSVPLKRVHLPADTRIGVHTPDTGRPAVWRLRIQTLDVGELLVCSPVAPRVSRFSHYVDQAAGFSWGRGWSTVNDVNASNGKAARAAEGTSGPEGAFSTGFLPAPGIYDVWYRVRVTQNSGTKDEMTLGLVDADVGQDVASVTLRPNQAGKGYKWVLVGSNVMVPSGHLVKFQTNVVSRLSTDWFIDQALMVAAGSPPS
jgi:hypothetical protein